MSIDIEDYTLAKECKRNVKYHYFPNLTYDTKGNTTSVCGRVTNQYNNPDMETYRQGYPICKICQRFSLLLQLGE